MKKLFESSPFKRGTRIKVSALDELVNELDNPAKQERVQARLIKRSRHERFCLQLGCDIEHKLLIPEGIFKMVWLVMVIFLILFYLSVVPLRLAFTSTSKDPFISGSEEWYIFDVFADVVFIMDIIMNFFTPHRTVDGEIEADHGEIARAYCQQWFWLEYDLDQLNIRVLQTLSPETYLQTYRGV